MGLFNKRKPVVVNWPSTQCQKMVLYLNGRFNLKHYQLESMVNKLILKNSGLYNREGGDRLLMLHILKLANEMDHLRGQPIDQMKFLNYMGNHSVFNGIKFSLETWFDRLQYPNFMYSFYIKAHKYVRNRGFELDPTKSCVLEDILEDSLIEELDRTMKTLWGTIWEGNVVEGMMSILIHNSIKFMAYHYQNPDMVEKVLLEWWNEQEQVDAVKKAFLEYANNLYF